MISCLLGANACKVKSIMSGKTEVWSFSFVVLQVNSTETVWFVMSRERMGEPRPTSLFTNALPALFRATAAAVMLLNVLGCRLTY